MIVCNYLEILAVCWVQTTSQLLQLIHVLKSTLFDCKPLQIVTVVP